MSRKNKISTFTLLLIVLFLLSASACAERALEAQPVAVATPAIRASDQALAARRALLGFLRESANECVPPSGVSWATTIGAAPEGFEVFLFASEGCFISVANPVPAGEETIYHVALHNGQTGFCYQAHVDSAGRVASTGSRAALPQPLADAAAAYCLDQGYEHDIQEQPDGTRCGVCTFDDGRSCKAWAFYQGMCE